MKTKVLVVVAIALVGASSLYWLADPRQKPPPPVQEEAPPAANKDLQPGPAPQLNEEMSAGEAQPHLFVGTTPSGKKLTIDLTRLEERGYENDPNVQAIAQGIGIPAACVLENFRIAEGMQDAQSQYCIDSEPVVEDVPYYAIQNPEFEKYDNDQLTLLAEYELDAAMLLARRNADAGKLREAQKYYELAMQMLAAEGRDPVVVRNEMKGRLP